MIELTVFSPTGSTFRTDDNTMDLKTVLRAMMDGYRMSGWKIEVKE